MNEEFWKSLKARGIDPSKVVERFVRASGNGGQNVNKVSTAVQLELLSHELRVYCADERSQYQNRISAWSTLIQRLDHGVSQARAARVEKREKIRRQKRKRPRGLKEKILKTKKIRSAVKKNRGGNWD
ncbi:MAG: peptide chain release factor-like protein [Verrucomicrobiota bacterium]